jgi:membrane associated rhomboid family serine protease
MSIREINDVEGQSAEAIEGESADPVRPPFAYYTYALMACIIVVAIVQFLTDPPAVKELGYIPYSVWAAGFVKQLFLEGEYWRFLTASVVHANPVHIAFNSYAFYSFGKLVEQLSNRANVAIIFLLAAIGGGAASLVFNPTAISVGASGGIIGLLGYMIVYSMKRRQFLEKEFRRSLIFNAGFILVYGLILSESIDNYAHAGGFVTGAIYGLFQVTGDPYKDPREAGQLIKFAGIASLAITILTCILAIVLILNFNVQSILNKL